MALITLKRGLAANLPTLSVAEPAWTTDTEKLYIGNAGGNVLINPFTETQAQSILDQLAGLGTSSTKDTGTTEGTVPILGAGGKLDPSVIPANFVNNVYVVADVSDLITLTDAQVGDIAVVTSTSESYALQSLPATTESNWVKLLFNNSVLSVNSKTGVVVLNGSDLLLPDYAIGTSTTILTSDTVSEALGKLAYADTLLAPLASPAFTGVPTAPTAALGTDTTQVATTAFVQAEIAQITPAQGFVHSVNTLTPDASGNITLGAADIDITGYAIGTAYTPLVGTMSINEALASLEYAIVNIDGGGF